MLITREDFEEEFLKKFSVKNQNYIIGFCNTFNETFPDIMDKKTIIERISRIQRINEKKLVNGINGEVIYGNYNINYQEGLSIEEEKNTIYHELLHVLSFHNEPEYNLYNLRGLYDEGIKFWDEVDDNSLYKESPLFDEIMNEYYTIKMLQTEGINKRDYYMLKTRTLIDLSTEKVEYHGNGYIEQVQLANIYNELFGDDLLKAKLYNRQEFEVFFNKKFKEIIINLPKEDGVPLFEKIGKQISTDLYGAYETAIDIWKNNKKDQIKDNKYTFYDYLKDTRELINYLPQRENPLSYKMDKSENGIPEKLFSKIQQVDTEYICEFLNPDILKIQDEDMKKRETNKLLSVINILRENIQDLSEQDLAKISYGIIEEYTHNGRDCMIINTTKKDFMTFVNNSLELNDQFSTYCVFKKIPEYKEFGFSRKTEEKLKNMLSDKGYIIDDFTYSVVYDSGKWPLIKSNNSYYKLSGELSDVKLSDIKTIGKATEITSKASKAQEQTIGKSQAQVERKEKDKEAEGTTQMQSKNKMLTQTYQSTQIRQGDIDKSFEKIQQTKNKQEQQQNKTR